MYNDTSSTVPTVLTTVFRIEPLIVSYIEISLAIAALFFSLGLVVYIIYFYMKKHQTITKNHKRMIIGVLIMCIMECFILAFRIIYDSFNISFGKRFQHFANTLLLGSGGNNSTISEYVYFDTFLWYNNTLGITPQDVGITMGEIVIYIISVAAELFMLLLNVQVMIIIVWFVTLVFVETFRISSGRLNSKKVHYFVNIVTIFTTINSIGLVAINLVVTVLTIVQRLGYISDESIMYVYGLCLIIFIIQIGIQITLLIIAATVMLKTISAISIENQNKRRTIIKILALQSGLFGCFLFEAFAAGCGVAQEDPQTAHFALGYSTANSLGILIFACTALALYTPFRALSKRASSSSAIHHQSDIHSLKSNNLSSSSHKKTSTLGRQSQYSTNNNTTTTPRGQIPRFKEVDKHDHDTTDTTAVAEDNTTSIVPGESDQAVVVEQTATLPSSNVPSENVDVVVNNI